MLKRMFAPPTDPCVQQKTAVSNRWRFKSPEAEGNWSGRGRSTVSGYTGYFRLSV